MQNKEVTHKQIITSLLVGDGYMNYSEEHGHYRIGTTSSNKYYEDYHNWKHSLMVNIFGDKVRKCLTKNDILISYYSNKKDITPYYKFLYRNNNGKNERVCSKFLQRLNHPMCLAIWFMDDGSCCGNKSYNSKGEKYFTSYSFYLATNQFNYSDHELMVKWFKQEFDIDCKIYKQIYSNPNHCGYGRMEYRLHFNASNSKKIWQLINPYVIQFDSMKYKFRFAYLRDNLNIKRIPIDFELSDYIK